MKLSNASELYGPLGVAATLLLWAYIISRLVLTSASINVAASRCTTTSGLFSIGFIRLAENARDLTFNEPFIWRLGQKRVVVEFWADEAVQTYWLADIAACPCRSV